MRIDKWLSQELPNVSRAQIQAWITQGHVHVGDRKPKTSYRVSADEIITVKATVFPRDTALAAEPLRLEILWENADAAVINKAPHMAVHPGAGRNSGTVANALLHRWPHLRAVGAPDRPGIVHRLDMDTSGVLLVAKHQAALSYFQTQFRQRTVFKEYLALVEGRPDSQSGRIEAPLFRRPGKIKQQVALRRQDATQFAARHAVTEYEVIETYATSIPGANARGNFTLLRAHPITGRTHQLRVHFAWLKHPIVGDKLYGFRAQRLAAPRMFLHAHRLRFRLLDNTEQEVAAPLPDDLQAVVRQLTSSVPEDF